MSIVNGEVILDYGPVGDPDSTDPFQWAQARMPDDWHVEGQVLTQQRYRGWRSIPDSMPVTWVASASHRTLKRNAGGWIDAIGYTPGLALANLVAKVPRPA